MKHWHGGDQRERWVGSGLLIAQKQFRRIIGHPHCFSSYATIPVSRASPAFRTSRLGWN